MRTVWGYEVSGNIDPIISVEEFNRITGNAYSGNADKVQAALKAASQAIRNYCGWHVSPSLACKAHPTGGAVVIKLPAGFVSNIQSVKEDGETLDGDSDFEWREDGLLKRAYPERWSNSWNAIEVEYTAGYDAAAVPDLVEAVCSIAAGVLAVSAGITSESADGVSVSYNANASSIAESLTSGQKSALAIYKVVSSHAA